MKRGVQAVVIAVSCQILLFSSVAFASMPVNYKSEGCVVGGKVFNLNQGKRQYTFELPKGYNLSPYEGKKVLLEGELTPGDYLVPKDKTMKILGPCTPGSEASMAAPAKPAAQPDKPKTAAPPQQTAPQSPKPVTQTPAKPPTPPTASKPPAVTPPAPPKPAQPAAVTPAPKPAQPPTNPAACKQNCQRQYDAKIQDCAGYKLGNPSKACKDPIERDLQACMSSCR